MSCEHLCSPVSYREPQAAMCDVSNPSCPPSRLFCWCLALLFQPCTQAGLEQPTDGQHEEVQVDPVQLQLEKQLLQRETADKGLALRYAVPWDIWWVGPTNQPTEQHPQGTPRMHRRAKGGAAAAAAAAEGHSSSATDATLKQCMKQHASPDPNLNLVCCLTGRSYRSQQASGWSTNPSLLQVGSSSS